ncbi:interleukin-2 receptor subunit beta-like [Scleropages formosus]|uniref:Interleukin-2 receptor subunit beta n=1 Tax=Scleropages formosus TaxID=113540 RepID=A0A8C9TD09_SCLFO|nr:interleukin-2 receptor subunit beta-like [Scleropages formosus]
MGKAVTAAALLSSNVLLLLLQSQLSTCTQSLTCVNDYINNITCVWNSSKTQPGVPCTLSGTKAEKTRTCALKPLHGANGILQRCHLVFEQNSFIALDKIPLSVKCGNSTVAVWKDYMPSNNIKMHPPNKIVVNLANVSWSPGTPLSQRIFSYHFQFQFKLQTQQWEDVQQINVQNKQQWLKLNEDNLDKGATYEARVRVKPDVHLVGEWSDWSPVATWRSEVGEPLRAKEAKREPLGDSLDSVALTVVTVTGVVCLALLVLVCTIFRDKWVDKVKFQHIPDPSKYFDNLTSMHGGNFQAWLKSTYAPHSFDIRQFSEDISSVEVSAVKDTAPLTCLDYSSLAEHWDSSGQSFYSNMGYFYSRYPGSYEIEPCSLYFSYQPGEGLSGREKDTQSTVNPGPLQSSSSYERLEQLREAGGQPQASDSGFGTLKDVQEETGEEAEAKEEEEGRLKDSADRSPSAPALSYPTPFQMPPFLPHYPQALNNFPQFLLPLPRFGLNIESCAPAPLEQPGVPPGRSASVKLEPSSGGYMSLQDMPGNGGNKSI